MKFRYLSQIGSHYVTEQGTSGHRTEHAVWRGIENNLKAAIADLRNAKSATAAHTGSRSVKDLVKFHENASKKGSGALQQEAQKRIEYYREWLRKEGATADQEGNVIMNGMDRLKVYYDSTAEAQGLSRIHFQNGMLYTSDRGRLKPLDTTNMVTHFSGPGKAIYVASVQGNLHVGSHVVGHYHHSSLLAGTPVACAGEMEVKQGKLVWLSNKSGHYVPQIAHLVQVLHMLKKRQVPYSFALTRHFAGGKKQYGSPNAFLSELDSLGEFDYELAKLMAYSQHLNDAVLGQNGWRWRNSSEEPGVYDVQSGRQIDHKTVRRWLKANGYSADDYSSQGFDYRKPSMPAARDAAAAPSGNGQANYVY